MYYGAQDTPPQNMTAREQKIICINHCIYRYIYINKFMYFIWCYVDWNWALRLLGRCSTTRATPPSPFCLCHSWDRFSHLCLGQLGLWSYLSFPSGWMTGVYQAPLFIGWDEISWTFCPDWPWPMILLISLSQVTRITDMSHKLGSKIYFFGVY
jgi:hypothetical protein